MSVRLQSVELKDYTTLRVGGRAQMIVVRTVEELQAAGENAKHFPAPPLLLGGGSNVLVKDEGYAGLVIKNEIKGRLYEQSGDTVFLTCGAGESLDGVIADACQRGYWGLENLSAIPGTVGATPIQNVGAYGVEVSALITAVTALHLVTGETRTFTNTECEFSYRHSFFKTEAGNEWCVTAVTFALSTTSRPQVSYADLQPLQAVGVLSPLQVREAVMSIRAKKFPDLTKVGTAGSFFKNPIITREQCKQLTEQYPELPSYTVDDVYVKVSLGWILDKVCGLRGVSDGSVGLYKQQALVLVNNGVATAAEIEVFAEKVAAQVKEKTTINIEWEVRRV